MWVPIQTILEPLKDHKPKNMPLKNFIGRIIVLVIP